MHQDSSDGPGLRLKRAALQTFGERPELAGIAWNGPLAQTWDALCRMLSLNADGLAARLAPAYGVPAAGPLVGRAVAAEVLGSLPAAFCQRHTLLPMTEEGAALVVATADPQSPEVAERARFLAGRPVQWQLAPPALIEDGLVVALSAQAAQDDAAATASTPDESGSPFQRIAQGLMETAVAQGASDLHIQPHLGACMVRMRVDGELRRMMMLQDAVGVTLVRHLKVRSAMDPTQHLAPQDGRMSGVIGGRDFEMRVSTLPASKGERMVIRFLDQGRVHRLAAAGFSLAALQALHRALARPSGLVLMTGPTGSGKTSTLYGMLSELNRPGVNILTVENPVEYRLPGVSQVEVNDKAGMSFHAALRAMLRQDPDVVLVGEIRDAETAQIAVQAALTGHLVLSTLHTNDAVTAIPRLRNLGVDPSILADALAAVVAQRLCRALCVACRQPVEEPLGAMDRLYEQITRNRPLYRPAGCAACGFTGYRGRLPIVDIIETNAALREAVAAGETRVSALEDLRQGGLKSMAVSGSHRILSGDTTVAEVASAVGPPFWPDLARHHGVPLPDDAMAVVSLEPAAGQAVLVITRDATLPAELSSAMATLGLRLQPCSSASQARDLLHRDEAIAFILGDVPGGHQTDEVAAALREFRSATAWSRLPSLVLLPAEMAGQAAELRRAGSLAEFMTKPVDADAIVQYIRRAHAR